MENKDQIKNLQIAYKNFLLSRENFENTSQIFSQEIFKAHEAGISMYAIAKSVGLEIQVIIWRYRNRKRRQNKC